MTAFIDKIASNITILDKKLNGGTLQLHLGMQESFVAGILSIYTQGSSRLLQRTAGSKGQLLISKSVDRYDFISPSNSAIIDVFRSIFSVLAWFGVISVICLTMLGCGVILEEYIWTAQLIFLHVYIAVEVLPASFI